MASLNSLVCACGFSSTDDRSHCLSEWSCISRIAVRSFWIVPPLPRARRGKIRGHGRYSLIYRLRLTHHLNPTYPIARSSTSDLVEGVGTGKKNLSFFQCPSSMALPSKLIREFSLLFQADQSTVFFQRGFGRVSRRSSLNSPSDLLIPFTWSLIWRCSSAKPNYWSGSSTRCPGYSYFRYFLLFSVLFWVRTIGEVLIAILFYFSFTFHCRSFQGSGRTGLS